MNFAWAKPASIAMIAALALAACGRSENVSGADAEAAKKAAQEFLIENSKVEGVKSLPSGLQYKIVTSGPADGKSPDSNDLVSVHYEGTLTDGTVFDSSFGRGSPAVFAPDQVVKGWTEAYTVEFSGSSGKGDRPLVLSYASSPAYEPDTEALQLMRPGDEWYLYVPPELGYGENQAGPIPAHSVLVFRLQVLNVADVPGGHKGGAPANG